MGKGKKPATYEDIEALPPGWVGEILQDELIASPRPAVGHAHVASVLGILLGGPFVLGRGGPGGWWLLDEQEIHLGRDVVVPDLSGWRQERMPEPPGPDEPFLTLVPDWVCEVISPSTEAVDRSRKLPLYHREGVAHVWLIEPRSRSLEVHRRDSAGWRRISRLSGEAEVRAEPFEASSFSLGLLWWPGPQRPTAGIP